MLFCESEHIPLNHYGEVDAIWLFRWRAKNKSEAARRAVKSQDEYRDKDGKQNWAEWSGKFPELDKLAKWADSDD